MLKNKLKTVPCIVLATVAAMGSATAHAAEPDVVVFQHVRPIAQVAKALSEKYGKAITYEDPPYVYEGDLFDETDPTYARENPGGLRALVPVSRTLVVDRSVWPAVTAGADLTATLETLMERLEQAGGPRFRLERTGKLLHIVPGRARNANGDWTDLTSILEVPITIGSHRTNGIGALTTIMKAVSAKIGIEVGIATYPLNLFARHETDLAAKGESARTVLMRVLAETGAPLSWYLHYGPKAGARPAFYMMNVRVVSGSR